MNIQNHPNTDGENFMFWSKYVDCFSRGWLNDQLLASMFILFQPSVSQVLVAVLKLAIHSWPFTDSPGLILATSSGNHHICDCDVQMNPEWSVIWGFNLLHTTTINSSVYCTSQFQCYHFRWVPLVKTSGQPIKSWLVVWNMTCIFHIWDVILPIHIFQRRRA